MRCEGNKFYSIAQFINKTIPFNIYILMFKGLSYNDDSLCHSYTASVKII
jgi:hypothetical protein